MLASLLLLQAAPVPTMPPAPPATIANPTSEALALGRQLAEAGMLSSLLPVIAAKETEEVIAAHPDLTEPDKAAYRRVASRTLAAGSDRLYAAEARAFAERLTPDELRTLVAFQRGPAASRYRAIVPAAIAAAMGAMQGMDFKKDSWAAFCNETKHRC